MASKIIVKAYGRKYNEADISIENLKDVIPSFFNKEDEILRRLGEDGTSINPSELTHYGCPVTLEDYSREGENMVLCMDRFFERAKCYADKYGVDYVLVDGLKFKRHHHSSDVSGLVQLLIKE